MVIYTIAIIAMNLDRQILFMLTKLIQVGYSQFVKNVLLKWHVIMIKKQINILTIEKRQ